jgi:putative sterol carrier protein
VLKYRFPSHEWARELCRQVNSSHYLREIGKDFTETIEVRVDNTPGRGLVRLYFKVVDGECKEARELSEEESPEATIVLYADYNTWLDMLSWRLSPTMAFFRRKLRVLRGSWRRIMSRPIAHYMLYYIASKITANNNVGHKTASQ